MPLSRIQKRHLKELAHSLKPVVILGQSGLSEGVHGETDAALLAHELIKIRVNAGDRELRDRLIGELVETATAELIQRIGNVAVLYRQNPKNKQALVLPKT